MTQRSHRGTEFGGLDSEHTSLGGAVRQVEANSFLFNAFPDGPRWRPPQRGALEAVSSHWMLEDPEPALVSLPTGSGKTAVGQALRYVAGAQRTLVVVPSQDLRRQLVSQYSSEQVLRDIGALKGDVFPKVLEHSGRGIEWESMRAYDVVVAIPSSISPAMMDDNFPPSDLFDLVLIDEAHHAPARTWKAILDHFINSKCVLLTATPQRRDGQRLPGRHVFHYPLRLALKHGVFKPIRPRILELAPAPSPEVRDEAILSEVVMLAADPRHETSAFLIRVGSADRAEELALMYSERGLECLPLHWRLSKRQRKERVAGWREGMPRALAVVDMLGEGIDLPSLRVVGYHDKHKSANATIQLIGRLARVHSGFPQESVLVTAQDHDVFPALQGVVRQLYAEDADWQRVLPRIIDDQIEEARQDREFATGFDNETGMLSLPALRPMARVTFFESQLQQYEPVFARGAIPEGLTVGHRLRGQEIVYSGVHSSNAILVIVTASLQTPRWYRGDQSLNSTAYDLHVVSWHPAQDVGIPSLLLVNTQDKHMCRALRRVLDPKTYTRAGRPESVQAVFEALDRTSVSSVGVRSTHVGAVGTTTYAMFAGSGVDRGLREADTQSRALGHAMAQAPCEQTTVTAGFSAEKAKYWETRYISLREYDTFVDNLVASYWEPRLSDAGVLLPNVSRGVRIEYFEATPIVVEMNPSLRGRGWELDDGTAIEDLELDLAEGSDENRIFMTVANVRTGEVVWSGWQGVDGSLEGAASQHFVRRGAYGDPRAVADMLASDPPSIYLADGSTVYGGIAFMPVATQSFLPEIFLTPWIWDGVDVTVESKTRERSDTIHDEIERRLRAVPTDGSSRWVLCNDGKGEIADHIVVERELSGRYRLELWHAKAASNRMPSVRVTDMQVVANQALKSRRYFTDREFWRKLGRRLVEEETPKATVVAGDREELLALCGLDPRRISERLDLHAPVLTGKIVIVQPGLSISALRKSVERDPVELAPGQVREFLVALHNATAGNQAVEVVGSA